MLNQGIDIYKVSKILGHSDIKTTTIYLHVATEKPPKEPECGGVVLRSRCASGGFMLKFGLNPKHERKSLLLH